MESVVLCEGYHDRAFWAGWLTHLGCTDPGLKPGKTTRSQVLDPWGAPVVAGQYAYRSTGGQFVRVVPCHGKEKILTAARLRLIERGSKALIRLVINVDSDVNADGTANAASTLGRQSVEASVRQIDPTMTVTAQGAIALDGGATEVPLVRWEASDVVAAGLPNQQTLERLVCAAMVGAYPDRGPIVQNWLDARPQAPQAGPKEFAWSYMAGWYAAHGCEDFYGSLWRDPKVVAELEPRLRSSGAWQIAEALAR